MIWFLYLNLLTQAHVIMIFDIIINIRTELGERYVYIRNNLFINDNSLSLSSYE